MTRPLAPTLRLLVAYGHESGRLSTDAADRELRALLAVARAAAWDHDDNGAGCPREAPCRVCRALARLSRVSAPRGAV